VRKDRPDVRPSRLSALVPELAADTVIFKSGKKLDNVVVSVNDDTRVVVNPWNSQQSRHEVGRSGRRTRFAKESREGGS